MEHDSKRHVFAIFCLFLESIKKIGKGDPTSKCFFRVFENIFRTKKLYTVEKLTWKVDYVKILPRSPMWNGVPIFFTYHSGALYHIGYMEWCSNFEKFVYHSGALFGMVFQFLFLLFSVYIKQLFLVLFGPSSVLFWYFLLFFGIFGYF